MKKRIRYFGLSDLSAPYYIDRAREIVEFNGGDIQVEDINDAIEISNIIKYLSEGISINNNENLKETLKDAIGNFLKTIKNSELLAIYDSLEKKLTPDFWEFIATYKLDKNFSKSEFKNLLLKREPDLQLILTNQKIVKNYDAVLGEYISRKNENVEIILNILEFDRLKENHCMFLPKSLKNEDIEKMIYNYISSELTNVKYLKAIYNITNRKEIRILDKTRLLAKKRLEKETDSFFQQNSACETEISISYPKNQKKRIVLKMERGSTHLAYSYDYIQNNLDYYSLYYNFIFLFEYIDNQARITAVSKEKDMSIWEKLFASSSKSSYQTNWFFCNKERLAHLQLASYIKLLKPLGRNIEDMIAWFFSKYLFEKFFISDFSVNIPSQETTYLEKCRILIPEIETILKKFNMLVDDNRIDLELLEISSGGFSFSGCKSFHKIKYIYPNSDEIKNVNYYLFSDQCILSYPSNIDKSYNSFFELLMNEKIKIDDYQEGLRKEIYWLIEKSYLQLNELGEIMLKDIELLMIVKELDEHEVISYINSPEGIRAKIDSLLDLGLLRSKSELFSEGEQRYFNYYHNRSQFGNSYDIRNIYVHGTQPSSEGNHEEHQNNYLIVLRIIILLMLKIDDELQMKTKITN